MILRLPSTMTLGLGLPSENYISSCLGHIYQSAIQRCSSCIERNMSKARRSCCRTLLRMSYCLLSRKARRLCSWRLWADTWTKTSCCYFQNETSRKTLNMFLKHISQSVLPVLILEKSSARNYEISMAQFRHTRNG